MKIATLTFEYNGTNYAALVNEKPLESGKEYRVTVMNGELEKLLYGDHVITEKNGTLKCVDDCPQEKKQLLHEIRKVLTNYLLQQALL